MIHKIIGILIIPMSYASTIHAFYWIILSTSQCFLVRLNYFDFLANALLSTPPWLSALRVLNREIHRVG